MFENIYNLVMLACSHVCGQNPEHSLLLLGYQFPLCYRCSGIYGFLFLGLILQAFIKYHISTESLLRGFFLLIFACVLLGADVFILQPFFPNNLSRFVSGCLVGASLSYLIYQCGVILVSGHNKAVPQKMTT